jgi:hypothetical protein
MKHVTQILGYLSGDEASSDVHDDPFHMQLITVAPIGFVFPEPGNFSVV